MKQKQILLSGNRQKHLVAINDIVLIDNIRLASVEEIIAMKVDVISRGGRKKDFWDIHELMNDYSVDTMFALHEKRHPYIHKRGELKEKFKEFENADNDFEPLCMKGKHLALIKLDTIICIVLYSSKSPIL